MESKGLFETARINNVIVITLPTRFDASISNDLKEIISKHINEGFYKFVIDFSKTTFIDSSGLGAIVSKISVCRANNGDVKLSNVAEKIKGVLSITHLDKILNIYADFESATNSYKQ
jgi:anti-sigma B factor antagonist